MNLRCGASGVHIYGCLVELKSLILKLDLKKDDHLILLGDLMDRGPDSVGVVRFVQNLSHMYILDLIQGNHEETHLRWWSHFAENVSGHLKMLQLWALQNAPPQRFQFSRS